ncbi:MAG: Ppx/GppA phosphatase family protein [Desulfotomaculales bacterium]
MRVAVIDLGTNSTRLLVAEVTGGRVKTLLTDMVTTRLGENIGGGYLLERAVARTIVAMKKFLETASSWRAERVAAVATSAVRGARNRQEFLQEAGKKTGLEIRVLTGEEEAFYGFLGVKSALPGAADGEKIVVVDVGGGSTEFCWENNQCLFFRSVDVGAVRAAEGQFTKEQIASLFSPVWKEIRFFAPGLVVGVGGTVTTLAAMAQRLKVYDSSLVHGFVLTREQVSGLFSMLRQTPLAERRRLPGLQPERADIIVAGTQIVLLTMDGLAQKTMLVSEADLLHGVAIELSK